MNWDPVQRLELELAQVRAENTSLTQQRDTARRVAMRLEDELANIAMVPYRGEAGE